MLSQINPKIANFILISLALNCIFGTTLRSANAHIVTQSSPLPQKDNNHYEKRTRVLKSNACGHLRITNNKTYPIIYLQMVDHKSIPPTQKYPKVPDQNPPTPVCTRGTFNLPLTLATTHFFYKGSIYYYVGQRQAQITLIYLIPKISKISSTKIPELRHDHD